MLIIDSNQHRAVFRSMFLQQLLFTYYSGRTFTASTMSIIKILL